MRAKFINENIENVLIPKSKDKIIELLQKQPISLLKKGPSIVKEVISKYGIDVDQLIYNHINKKLNKDLYNQAKKNNMLIDVVLCNLYKSAELLLKHNADPSYKNGLPLKIASRRNLPKIIKLLLDYGADINAGYDENLDKKYAQRTALGWASDNNIKNLLLKYGAKG